MGDVEATVNSLMDNYKVTVEVRFKSMESAFGSFTSKTGVEQASLRARIQDISNAASDCSSQVSEIDGKVGVHCVQIASLNEQLQNLAGQDREQDNGQSPDVVAQIHELSE